MLRVAGVLPPPDPPWVRVVDPVILDARWERPDSSIMFWQIESPGQWLMIAIDENSGAIMSIDPLLFHGASVQHGARLPALEERLGTPLIDKRDISTRGRDSFVITDAEVNSFRILLAEDACMFVWSDPAWIIRSERVLFGVNSAGLLAAVGVDGMNADEHRIVYRQLSDSGPSA